MPARYGMTLKRRPRDAAWRGATLKPFLLAVAVAVAAVLACVVDLEAADPPITSIAFAPDGKSLVASSQAGLQVLRWPELTREKQVEVKPPNVHSIAFSPNGLQLAVGGGAPSEGGAIELFAWPACESTQVLSGQEDSVMQVVWLGDSRIASASLDHSVSIWSLPDGMVARELRGHSRGVTGLCWLKEQKILVSTGIDQSLRVWNLMTGDLMRSLAMHTARVHAVALRPTDLGLPMIASASDDKTVRLWQPTIGRMVRFIKLNAKPLDIAWLDATRIVASCTDGQVYLIDSQTVEVIDVFPAIDGWAYALAVHPTDGSVAVGGSDGQLRRVTPP